MVRWRSSGRPLALLVQVSEALLESNLAVGGKTESIRTPFWGESGWEREWGGSRLLQLFICYFWLQEISVAVSSPLTVAASFVAEHGVSSTGSVVVKHSLSCTLAPGISPDQGCPPLAGRFLITRPPGKSPPQHTHFLTK